MAGGKRESTTQLVPTDTLLAEQLLRKRGYATQKCKCEFDDIDHRVSIYDRLCALGNSIQILHLIPHTAIRNFLRKNALNNSGFICGEIMAKHTKRPELTAVVIGDNFDPRFSPFLHSSQWAMKHLGALTALEACLIWLARTPVTNVILVVSTEDEKRFNELSSILHSYKTYFSGLLVSGKNIMSVGDAIREVEQRSLITGEFVLVHNVATICSSKLDEEFAAFRERRKTDKNNCLTLLYAQANHDMNPVIAVGRHTKKLMFYFKKERTLELDIKKDCYANDTEIRRDLRDTGIAFCAPSVAAQFTDNFDFQERDDIIRELLVNEEILCQHIHVEVLSDKYAASCVTDYASLLATEKLLMERWFFPIVPELRTFSNVNRNINTHGLRRRIYITASKEHVRIKQYHKIKSCYWNVCFNASLTLGRDCALENVVIEENVEIANNVTIKDCHIGKNVVIGNSCRLSNCVIGDNAVIGNNCNVTSKTFVGENVVIPDDTHITEGSIILMHRPDEDDYTIGEKNSYYEVRFKHRTGFWKNTHLERRRARTVSQAGDHTGDHHSEKEEADDETDIMRFFNEISESMQQAVDNMESEEHKTSNLILEINSSKLAYNMTMEDVAKNVFLAFLKLGYCSDLDSIKSLVKEWLHVFNNYYSPHKNQIQLLLALEEYSNAHAGIAKIANHIVHFLYSECDVLQEEAILEWFGTLISGSDMYEKIKPIVDWLQESSGEEESDEDAD
ncbi:hypothetical protein QR680_000068 [Steinernema hermaphroditum]|uniref:Translation initiation factor eIF2B subunit epsilon n=1 Tax=Steinernema hermaphroditum TaxID=289476 RepID=A0AA39GT80_9BILA|nr:hypothetical protein QR680_000068 [Steinernema hermaphroditum]